MASPIICLMGPTASGKTSLGVELAQRFNGEVISVDSALVYRGMDIGTAKPDATERQGIPHHLMDILDPAETYSASAFRDDAMALIAEVQGRGHLPVLVGGTMLYFRALLTPMANLPAADPALRDELTRRGETLGWPALHAQLQACDPMAAREIHPHNRQRLIRALEVHALSGQRISSLWQQYTPMLPPGEVSPDFPWPVIQLTVRPEQRADLHRRIEQRFDQMLAQNFAAEVRALHDRGDLTKEHPAVRCVGYRQMWAWLDGEIDWSTMRERGLAATRQLAKRQLTWLRGWQNLATFDTLCPDLHDRVSSHVEQGLNL